MRRIPPYLLVAFSGFMMFVLGVVTIFAEVGFQPTDQIKPTLIAMLTQMPAPAVATQLAQMGNVIPPDVQATAQAMYKQGVPLDVIIDVVAAALSDTHGANATVVPSAMPQPPIIATVVSPGGDQPTAISVVPLPTAALNVAQPTAEGLVPLPTAIVVVAQPTADTSVVVATAVETAVPAAQDVVEATVLGDVGNISGSIVYSDKASGDGISLMLTRPDGTTLNLPVAGDGNFAFAGMLPGAYTLEAAATGYLSARAEFTLDAGQNLTLTSGSLLVGDTNGDGIIDLLDAALIASNFGGSVIVPQADLNHDGQVDVSDLTLIGSEFGVAGPISWK